MGLLNEDTTITITKKEFFEVFTDISTEITTTMDDPAVIASVVILSGIIGAKLLTKLFDEREENNNGH